MPTAPTDDTQDYDPLVLADQDDETEEEDVTVALPVAEDVPPPDLSPDIEAEIHKVIPEEEPAPKAKAQMVPDHILRQELTVEDLMDKGSL